MLWQPLIQAPENHQPMADIDEKFSSLYTAQLFEYLLKFNRATAMTLQFLVNFANLIGTQ